jgi:hypothetical protein
MNVSGGSTDEDEAMFRFIETSSNTLKNSINLLAQEILNDSDDEDSSHKWGEGSQFGKAQNKPRDFAGTYQRLALAQLWSRYGSDNTVREDTAGLV